MDKFEELSVIAPKLLHMLQEHKTDIVGTPVSTALLTVIIASVTMILFSMVSKRKVAMRLSRFS